MKANPNASARDAVAACPFLVTGASGTLLELLATGGKRVF